MPGLPSVVFAVAALGPAALAFCLPDTSKSVLPEKMADAEQIDDEAANDTSDRATAVA